LSLFGVGAIPEPVSLFESAYLDLTGQVCGQLMADLGKEYSLTRLKASGPNGAAPNHVGVELQFMSALSGQEAAAADPNDPQNAPEAISRQRRFFENYLHFGSRPSLEW
jgi:TorA maturation chaperone TorD